MRSSRLVGLAAILIPALVGCGGGASPAPAGENPSDSGTASDTDTTHPADSDISSTDSGATDSGAETIAPLGTIEFLELGIPIDLTPDGRTAVLEDVLTKDTPLYFYDTVSKKMELKTTVGDPTMNAATGVSSNGRVTAMHGDPEMAAVWSETAGWLDFSNGDPKCDMFGGGAEDISADGKIVVGLNWKGCQAQAFIWTDASGTGVMKILQTIGVGAGSKPPSNRATVISDDGTMIGGFAGPGTRKPAMWNAADGTGFLLDPTDTDGNNGEVLSISADGKTAAGIVHAYEGFVWTKEKGIVKLGELADQPKYSPTYPMAVVAGGKLIFGKNGTPLDDSEVAMVWTEAKGMRAMTDILKASGITIPDGWRLIHALRASADGSIVLGMALDTKGLRKTYVLHLPADTYLK